MSPSLAARADWSTTWVVKTSKFCNLRCAYCYEWDDLADRARMSRSTFLRLLDAVASQHELVRDSGRTPRTSVVLHGGEPLSLPLAELEWLCASFTDRFGGSDEYRLGLQTNLFRLSDAHLTLLRRHRISVGVSFDAVPGVRVSAGGRETEDRVVANMARLAEARVPFGMITVLAAHTAPHVAALYAWVKRQGLAWRILPLFDGPATRDSAAFDLDRAALVSALCAAFDLWFDDGAVHPVDPFTELLSVAVRHLAGFRPRLYDRARDGDGVFVVDLDGGLYRVVDGYDAGLALGGVALQSLPEILASPAYRRSLDRDGEARALHCAGCEFAGPCSGWPVFEARHRPEPDTRCFTAHPLLTHIQRRLVSAGYDTARLLQMTDTLIGVP
ncbi:uncharacterized protein EDD29_4498 [Actinocorallia herbida]|uniref:Radical SAM core domain-containing protein n=1 Tax=Actinocorallia herbida TaxID=58109 RepID=A0A3N1D064_9ACTN|nr:radical SAM protein [Actinocorallia herbida]ROO86914.1 uncharacterized protein EDD29_4498 [Actinocorallia herbida]